MTHLLPPNLLKLFAPRPPLPYVRPVGRYPGTVTKKRVDPIAPLFARIREETAEGIISKGKAGESSLKVEEEQDFTLAEEVKRQIHREQKKQIKLNSYNEAKENCK